MVVGDGRWDPFLYEYWVERNHYHGKGPKIKSVNRPSESRDYLSSFRHINIQRL